MGPIVIYLPWRTVCFILPTSSTENLPFFNRAYRDNRCRSYILKCTELQVLPISIATVSMSSSFASVAFLILSNSSNRNELIVTPTVIVLFLFFLTWLASDQLLFLLLGQHLLHLLELILDLELASLRNQWEHIVFQRRHIGNAIVKCEKTKCSFSFASSNQSHLVCPSSPRGISPVKEMSYFRKVAWADLKEREFRYEVCDGVHKCVIGGVVRGGLDSQHNLSNNNAAIFQWREILVKGYRVLKRVRILVASKQHIGIFQQLLTDLWQKRLKVSFEINLKVPTMLPMVWSSLLMVNMAAFGTCKR